MNADLAADAVALAGSLAEAGVQRIEFREPGHDWKFLAARVTDLPGLIAHAQDGAELRWPGGKARVEYGRLSWWGGGSGGGAGGGGGSGVPSRPA